MYAVGTYVSLVFIRVPKEKIIIIITLIHIARNGSVILQGGGGE